LFEGDASHTAQGRPLGSRTDDSPEVPQQKAVSTHIKNKTENRSKIFDLNQTIPLTRFLHGWSRASAIMRIVMPQIKPSSINKLDAFAPQPVCSAKIEPSGAPPSGVIFLILCRYLLTSVPGGMISPSVKIQTKECPHENEEATPCNERNSR
jgi:hypothetical protein